MLASPNRLHKKLDFEAVYQRGRRQSGPLFNLSFTPNKLAATRFAFVVSKKTAKLAVTRNLVRRRLRAIVQKQLSQINPGFDVVIMIKTAAIKADLPELQEQLFKLFRTAKLIK